MEAHLREAEAVARTLGDQRRLGTILQFGVMPRMNAGRYAEALQCGRDALSIGAELGDRSIEAPSLYGVGMVHTARGELREAVDVLERSMELVQGDLLYERLGQSALPSVFARCVTSPTPCLSSAGSTKQSRTPARLSASQRPSLIPSA
jgi:hypothetical protein